MLGASFSVASGSCAHTLNFILDDSFNTTAFSSTGDADFLLPATASAIGALGNVKDALYGITFLFVKDPTAESCMGTLFSLHRHRHSGTRPLEHCLRNLASECRRAGKRLYTPYAGLAIWLRRHISALETFISHRVAQFLSMGSNQPIRGVGTSAIARCVRTCPTAPDGRRRRESRKREPFSADTGSGPHAYATNARTQQTYIRGTGNGEYKDTNEGTGIAKRSPHMRATVAPLLRRIRATGSRATWFRTPRPRRPDYPRQRESHQADLREHEGANEAPGQAPAQLAQGYRTASATQPSHADDGQSRESTARVLSFWTPTWRSREGGSSHTTGNLGQSGIRAPPGPADGIRDTAAETKLSVDARKRALGANADFVTASDCAACGSALLCATRGRARAFPPDQ